MAKSYYPLQDADRVEEVPSDTVVDVRSGLRYVVLEQSDGLYQEEFILDKTVGQKIHSLARRMDYVIGSGTAARTYLTEHNGRLFELPLTWYTQQRRWDFSPGYDLANHRFGRAVPDRCMACHNSYPQSVPYVEGKYVEVPNGIGCERCHGPGDLHVRERLEVPEPVSEVDESIVNPAHLSFELRLDVCQQCHLHTTISLLREGRKAFDFRPGQPLSEHIALFAEEDPSQEEGIDVISHADRMKQSECYLATIGTERPLECTTCHDPHQGFRSFGSDYFDSTCVSCHSANALRERLMGSPYAAEHTPSSNCFGCHMPKVEVEDAPHSSFTDHRIRVVQDDLAAEPVAAHDKVVLRPYFSRDQNTDSGAIYESMAQVIYGKQTGQLALIRKGVDRLETLLERDTTNSEGLFLMGLGHQMLGEYEKSYSPLESAVRLAPENPERLNALAQSYELGGVKLNIAGRLYRRALSIQPAAADIRVNYGRFLESQGLLDQAAVQYREAVGEDDRFEVGYYNLGAVALAQGKLGLAEEALEKAVSLNPLYTEALGNLGLVYLAQSREVDAGRVFERAVIIAPADPTALGNLGAFKLNTGSEEDAIELLRRAVALNPTIVDAIANLGLAYFRVGDLETARQYARRALEIDGSNQLARQVIAATD